MQALQQQREPGDALTSAGLGLLWSWDSFPVCAHKMDGQREGKGGIVQPYEQHQPLLLRTQNHLPCCLPGCLKLISTPRFITSLYSRSAQNLVQSSCLIILQHENEKAAGHDYFVQLEYVGERNLRNSADSSSDDEK